MRRFSFGVSLSFRKPVVASVLFVVLSMLVVGCDNEKTRGLINGRAEEARQSLGQASQPGVPSSYNPLVVTDKVWAGSSALRMHRGVPLPPKYETTRGITLVSTEPMSLADIANAITVQTGVPVHVIETGVVRTAGAGNAAMPVAYEGPLSGLMERVVGYFGMGWHYDGATISVSRFETRVFAIEALPGSQSVSEGMQDDTGGSSSGGAGGSSGGGSSTSSITQNSKFNIDLKYWDEIGQVLTSMLAGTGTVVVSPSLGIITVSTTPEIMRAVAEYLSQENKRLSRQIAINVEVYSVNLSEGEDFNVAFTAFLSRMANFGGFTYSSAGAPSSVGGLSGLGALSLAVLNPSNNRIVHAGDVFNALSAIGDTTTVAQFPMTTINNRPVSRRVGTDRAYVASSTSNNAGTTSGGTAAVGTTVTPGTIHEGFSVQVTPRLLDDGRILMQYSLSLTGLESIVSFNSECGSDCSGSSGSSTVQLPQTTNRIFVQQSVLRSGSMLVIGGVDQEDIGQSAQGVGNPFNFLLGGGSSNSIKHTMVFVAITPQVMDLPQAEHD